MSEILFFLALYLALGWRCCVLVGRVIRAGMDDTPVPERRQQLAAAAGRRTS